MDEKMMKALEADGEKLRQMTGEDHGPHLAEVDAEVERILAMTDEECRAAGIAEFGTEEAYRAAMKEMRDRMLATVDAHIAQAEGRT